MWERLPAAIAPFGHLGDRGWKPLPHDNHKFSFHLTNTHRDLPYPEAFSPNRIHLGAPSKILQKTAKSFRVSRSNLIKLIV